MNVQPIPGLRIVESTAAHAFGTWRNIVLYVWRRETSLAAAQALTRLTAEVARDWVPPLGLFGAVEPSAPLPSSEARDALTRALRANDGVIRASALVFEGQGFQSSAVRAVATGLALLSRAPFPHRVHGDVENAASWLEDQLVRSGAAPFSSQALAQALTSLRAR